MPQITISAVHELVKELRKGWAGFSARERFPADHDWVLAYLSRAGMGRRGYAPKPSPPTSSRESAVRPAARPCWKRSSEVEAATTAFEQSDYGFGFPVPSLMMKHWEKARPDTGVSLPGAGSLPERTGGLASSLPAGQGRRTLPAARSGSEDWSSQSITSTPWKRFAWPRRPSRRGRPKRR